jgi:hypothetical protein
LDVAGPAHIGTAFVASSFKNVHYHHARPIGDDFAFQRHAIDAKNLIVTSRPSPPASSDQNVLARGDPQGKKSSDNITHKDAEEHPDDLVFTPLAPPAFSKKT